MINQIMKLFISFRAHFVFISFIWFANFPLPTAVLFCLPYQPIIHTNCLSRIWLLLVYLPKQLWNCICGKLCATFTCPHSLQLNTKVHMRPHTHTHTHAHKYEYTCSSRVRIKSQVALLSRPSLWLSPLSFILIVRVCDSSSQAPSMILLGPHAAPLFSIFFLAELKYKCLYLRVCVRACVHKHTNKSVQHLVFATWNVPPRTHQKFVPGFFQNQMHP